MQSCLYLPVLQLWLLLNAVCANVTCGVDLMSQLLIDVGTPRVSSLAKCTKDLVSQSFAKLHCSVNITLCSFKNGVNKCFLPIFENWRKYIVFVYQVKCMTFLFWVFNAAVLML